MTITICPKCGSMNITTAGVCANCGWSQFAQVTTVSTRITDEIEIMLSGKALLDDYKRLLFENRNLKERVAELEAENTALKQHPQPIEFWSDEKKELYRRNESRTIKSGREEEREIACKHCHGTGTVYLEGSIHGEDICPKCHGTGIKERAK